MRGKYEKKSTLLIAPVLNAYQSEKRDRSIVLGEKKGWVWVVGGEATSEGNKRQGLGRKRKS